MSLADTTNIKGAGGASARAGGESAGSIPTPAPKMPIFLVDGLSHEPGHPDIRGRVDRTARGTLPSFHLEDDGGFLYLRRGAGMGSKPKEVPGTLAWIKDHLYADTLVMLDRHETPWRRRTTTVAIQDGGKKSTGCWVYCPEFEAGSLQGLV